MPLAVFLFTLLAAAGSFIDFLIGNSGKKETKDVLVRWYVELGIRSWSDLAIVSANSVDRFLNSLLGQRIWSWRAPVRLLGFSAVFDIALIVATYAPKAVRGAGLGSVTHYWWAIPMVILSNTVVSAASLGLIRSIYRAVPKTPRPSALAGLTVADFALAYLGAAATVTLTATTFISIAVYGVCFGCWAMLLPQKALSTFAHPWHAPLGLAGTNSALFAISAVLPSLLHFATFLVLYLFSLSKPALQRPIMHVLERLDEGPNGVFTRIGTAFGVIAAILAALKSVVSVR